MGVTNYKIKQGDTLSGISKQTGVSVADLAKANGISNPNKIYAGATIKIPSLTNSWGTKANPNTNSTHPNGQNNIVVNEDKNPYTNISLSQFDSGYQKSDDVLAAEKKKTGAENAVSSYGDYGYGKQGTLDEVINKILNREEFSYDLNGDALYQQYKDKYIQQGKMAMQDTMGQAAAMTGGYGNSYAATAGNQAYQAHLENLNDVIPELYQMAYDRYNQEGQDLYNQYSMLSDDKSMDYGMWSDKYNQLVADRDYYGNEANNAFNKDYGVWSDNRDYDTNQYWNETNFGYGQERDKIADQQWQTSFDEGVRQYNESMAYQKERDKVADEQWAADHALKKSSSSSGGSGGSGSGSGKGNTSSGSGSNDGGYTYVKNKTTTDFLNLFPDTTTFNRYDDGYEYNGKKYKDWEEFCDAKISDAIDSGKLTEDEAYSVMVDLGLV